MEESDLYANLLFTMLKSFELTNISDNMDQ